MKKVDSAVIALRRMNPGVRYRTYPEHLTPETAEKIVKDYDIVLDCTDRPSSRYLISDICVLLGKPLVSASALRMDGQLMVLNYPPGKGPCYRCIFPKPPPAEQVLACGDGGILGPVVGVMGVLQAVETIKLIVAGSREEDMDPRKTVPPPSMLIFSANSGISPFRSVKLRGKRQSCFACGEIPGLTRDSLKSGSLDYVAFCGSAGPVDLVKPEEQITVDDLDKEIKEGKEHLLLDVRDEVQYGICHLDGSINVPFTKLQYMKDLSQQTLLADIAQKNTPIYVVCRMGNDSQVVTKKLKELGLEAGGKRPIADVRGGFRAWKDRIDHSWPDY
jgi:adenylyltransferase/sulfurtransferase